MIKSAKRILVVCSQNRLRSVLGSEALGALRPDLRIESAGISSDGHRFGRKPDKRTRDIIQGRYGLDVSDYRSHAATEEMIKRADRILAFSNHSCKELVKCFPAEQGKIELFCQRSVSAWNVKPTEIFEQDILPAAEHWTSLL